MEITMTPAEIEKIFHTALCDTFGGSLMLDYNIELCYNRFRYREAKKELISQGNDPAYEDILMQILKRGDALICKDLEGAGEMNRMIYLKDVYERVAEMDPLLLVRFIEGETDANDADMLLQCVFYGEVIFS